MPKSSDFLIIGAGIFGVTAALELHRRGHSVALLDPGPIPHPLAASTDISKVVRMEYGADRVYLRMADQAIDGWLRWNEELDETLYHQTGVLMLARQPLQPGSHLYESYQALLAEGKRPERLNSEELARRFPAIASQRYVDGFFHARGGFVESGRVVEALLRQAQQAGVAVHSGQTAAELLAKRGRISGARSREGEAFLAGHVIVAAGSWTQTLLPELQGVMKATGHPVFHVRPADPTLFAPPNLVVWTADVANSGWYGFPLHPREGIVKLANHGVGRVLHPEHDERVVYDSDLVSLRSFLAETFPALLDAEIVYTRRCLYSDTLDEHFWIDRHPEKPGLTVAAGGSGHAFKFGPILGPLIADAAEGQANLWGARFRWRDLSGDTRGQEASRFHGPGELA